MFVLITFVSLQGSDKTDNLRYIARAFQFDAHPQKV